MSMRDESVPNVNFGCKSFRLLRSSACPSVPPAVLARRPHGFLLILANVLWACSYVAAKYVLRDISANMMNALRMIIAAMVLLPLLIARRKDLNLTRRDLPQLALLAVIGIVLAKTFEFWGLAFSSASDVALLITSESIFTAVLSWLLLRERFKILTVFALLLGMFGVYLIVERSLVPNIPSGGGCPAHSRRCTGYSGASM